jgi:hypothetical protein
MQSEAGMRSIDADNTAYTTSRTFDANVGTVFPLAILEGVTYADILQLPSLSFAPIRKFFPY